MNLNMHRVESGSTECGWKRGKRLAKITDTAGRHGGLDKPAFSWKVRAAIVLDGQGNSTPRPSGHRLLMRTFLCHAERSAEGRVVEARATIVRNGQGNSTPALLLHHSSALRRPNSATTIGTVPRQARDDLGASPATLPKKKRARENAMLSMPRSMRLHSSPAASWPQRRRVLSHKPTPRGAHRLDVDRCHGRGLLRRRPRLLSR